VPPLLEWGLEFIRAIATVRTPALDAIMEGFTRLGNQETYLLLVPLLLWCVELSLAIRLALAFVASSYLNTVLKDLLMEPRPCDLAPVCILEAEGYGLPSGHAQSAVLVWGLVASQVRRGWFWAVAILLMLLIGFSRVYLGVHFPTDVLAGWVLGLALLMAYFRWGAKIESWVLGLGPGNQILIAVAMAVLLFLIHPVKDVAAAVSSFAGLGIGLALMRRYVPFSASGPLLQRILRYAVGAVVVLGLFVGLRVILPAEGEPLYLPSRLLRYGLVGLWTTLGAPWLFLKLRLAPRRKEPAPTMVASPP